MDKTIEIEPLTEKLRMTFDDPVLFPGTGTVLVDDTALFHHPGLPRVPVRTKTIELPAGATVTGISYDHGAPLVMDVPFKVELSDPMYPIGPAGPILTDPVEMYYDGDIFPSDWLAYDIGRGLNPQEEPTIFVNIFAYPIRVQGFGVGQSIIHINGLDIEVDYLPPEDSGSRAEEYDMVLIGPTQFRDELQVLADHKDATGLRCKVVTLSDIYQGEHFTTQGRDNPEKMKYFIKNALDIWGIKYALLGGDIDKVPSRVTKVVDGFDDDAAMQLDGQWTRSDAYFGDIYDGSNQFSSWDENGNGTFGEWLGGRNGAAADDPDFYLDVYVGRLPASTATELTSIVDKVIQYENGTDWDWFFKSTIAALDIHYPPKDPIDIDEGELSGDILADDLLAKGYSVQKLYEAYGTLTSGSINSAINGGVGLIDMIGHGTYTAWGSNMQLYYQNSNIASLVNGVKLPVGHQASCLTAAFDNEDPTYYPGPENKDSMGEEFVKRDGGGHIANYGYSRVAYGGAAYDHPNQTSGYMNTVLFNLLADGPTTPGKALNDARNDCMANLGISFVGDFKHMSFFILFGDPSVALGGVGLSISADTNQLDILPNETLQVDLYVKNVGAYDTTATLALVGAGSPWSASIDKSTIGLATGQQEKVTLTIQAPTSLDAGDIGRFTLEATSSANGRKATGTVEATVEKVQGIKISVDDDRKSAFPGEDIVFGLDVTNTGNSLETTTLTLTDEPSGWTEEFDAGSLELQAQGSNGTNMTLTVPGQTLVGTYLMNVTVEIEGTSVTSTQMITVDIKGQHSFTVVCQDPGQDIAPGEETTLVLRVDNLGNMDEVINIGSVNLSGGWKVRFDAMSLSIGPYSSKTVNLTVTAGPTSLIGTYPILTPFTSANYNLLYTTDVSVKGVRGLEMELPVDNVVRDGDSPTVQFLIKNTGNIFEEVELECLDEPKGWNVELMNTTVDLDPFESKDVDLKVGVPSHTTAGDYYITIFASGTGQLEGTMALNVTVQPRIGAIAELTESPIRADPGETISSTVAFNNTGNIGLRVSLSTGLAKGLTVVVGDDPATVAPGKMAEIQYTVLVPSTAQAGRLDYELVVHWGQDGQAILSGVVLVNQIHDLDITLVADSGHTRRIKIVNIGNGAEKLTISVEGLAAKWVTVTPRTMDLDTSVIREVEVKFKPPGGASEGLYKVDIIITSDGDEVGKEVISFKIEDDSGPMESVLGPGAIGAWLLAIIIAAMVVFYLAMRFSHGASRAPEEEAEDKEEGAREEE